MSYIEVMKECLQRNIDLNGDMSEDEQQSWINKLKEQSLYRLTFHYLVDKDVLELGCISNLREEFSKYCDCNNIHYIDSEECTLMDNYAIINIHFDSENDAQSVIDMLVIKSDGKIIFSAIEKIH